MRTTITTILVLILTISCFGNDGAYLIRGSVIYPMKESKISLDREILSFSVRNKICFVDILFEFNNLDNVERKLLIGFQAPAGGGDISDELVKTSQITDFRIISNNTILPYKIMAAECEDCELRNPEELHFSPEDPGVFVYLFELTFKPGKNQVNHSYAFPASENVFFDQMYNYILTTGAKWAGGIIKNLTVQFDLGSNKYFYVHDVFGKNAVWSIIGSGKVPGKRFDHSFRMVRILSGKLQIDVKDFKPMENIEFGIICENSFITIPTDSAKIKKDEVYSIGNLTLSGDKNYTKEELKLLRNTVYAQYGYTFKTKELRDYFSQFEWYMPDPNLTLGKIVLTKEEQKFIEEIIKRENE